MRATRTMALLFSLIASGCAYNSPYMREVTDLTPPSPRTGHGTVVFIRPSGFGWGVGALIFDENRQFVGDLGAKSHIVVEVTPGPHRYVVWAESADAIQVDVVAGKVYPVEMGIAMGFFSPQFYFNAITPRWKNWPLWQRWLSSTRRMTADEQSGTAYLDRRAHDVSKQLSEGLANLRGMHGDALAKHTLRAEDGLAASMVMETLAP